MELPDFHPMLFAEPIMGTHQGTVLRLARMGHVALPGAGGKRRSTQTTSPDCIKGVDPKGSSSYCN